MILPNFYYLESRGISKETCKLFKCGMIGAGALYGRVGWPIYNIKNKIVGYNGRLVSPHPTKQKYKIWGNKSANFVYPVFLTDKYIKESKVAVLVESVLDCMSLWDNDIKNTIQLFGLNLSKKVLAYLISVNPKYIIISTNNDNEKEKNRGLLAAEKIKAKLEKFFDKDRIIIKLPETNDWSRNTEDKQEVIKTRIEDIKQFKKYIEELK